MAQNASNVSNARPNAAGALYRCSEILSPESLPTDAVESLPSSAANLGYAGDDGLTNSFDISNDTFNAWGGDVVGTYRTSYEETFAFNMIETKADTMRASYGDDNVIITPSGLAVVHRAADVDYTTWFFEVLLSGNRVKRIVVPEAKPTDRDDVNHQDGELLGYGLTLSTRPVSLEVDGQTFTGVTAVEYIAGIDDGGNGGGGGAEG